MTPAAPPTYLVPPPPSDGTGNHMLRQYLELRQVQTLGDLCLLEQRLTAATDRNAPDNTTATNELSLVFFTWYPQGTVTLTARAALHELSVLTRAIRPEWLQTARQLVTPANASGTLQDRNNAISTILGRLELCRGDLRLPLSSFTVSSYTKLLLVSAPATIAKEERQQGFLTLLGTPVNTMAQARERLQDTFASIWKADMDNHWRSVWYRLVYNGIAVKSRITPPPHPPCGCAEGVHDRQHVFWDCPVARAVVRQLEAHLAAKGHPVELTRTHLLGIQPPLPPTILVPSVWEIVALAAIKALNDTTFLLNPPDNKPPVPVATTIRRALSRFHSGLAEHCAVMAKPKKGLRDEFSVLTNDVALSHPFIDLYSSQPGQPSKLRLTYTTAGP
jgi:hypothetical protein